MAPRRYSSTGGKDSEDRRRRRGELYAGGRSCWRALDRPGGGADSAERPGGPRQRPPRLLTLRTGDALWRAAFVAGLVLGALAYVSAADVPVAVVAPAARCPR